jgi:hypothetical protein
MVSDTIVFGMLLGLAVSLWCCVYYVATDSGLNPWHEHAIASVGTGERSRGDRRGRGQQWFRPLCIPRERYKLASKHRPQEMNICLETNYADVVCSL